MMEQGRTGIVCTTEIRSGIETFFFFFFFFMGRDETIFFLLSFDGSGIP